MTPRSESEFGMQWFGPLCNLAICLESPTCPTPIRSCIHCQESFTSNDRGIRDAGGSVLHLECFMRGIFGSASHQLGLCLCFGGVWEDPPELSTREAARLSFDLAFKGRSIEFEE